MTEPWYCERFWNKVEARANGCWEWTGCVCGRDGYGRFMLDGASRGSHRVALALFGRDIPPGLEVDHLCRNRGCVNPVHLEIVTHKCNTLRGLAPSANQARRSHCVYGHALIADASRPGRRVCAECRMRRYRRQVVRRRSVHWPDPIRVSLCGYAQRAARPPSQMAALPDAVTCRACNNLLAAAERAAKAPQAEG